MEIVAAGLEAVGRAIAAVAWSTGLVYIVGIGTKTWLITNGDAKPEELKDWFNFYKRKNKNL